MRKMKVLVLAFVLFFISDHVYAVCDASESTELNGLANNVNVAYDIIQKEIPKDENFNYPDGLTEEEREEFVAYDDYFRIIISNLTEDLYVVVTNENTGEKWTFTYADSDNGIVNFDDLALMEIVNYTIVVYSSDVTNCPDTELSTKKVSTPMYNPYSELVACEGIENFYLCHEYLEVDVDFSNFNEEVLRYSDGLIDDSGDEISDEEDDGNGFVQFLKDNIVMVIVVVVVIIVAGGLITFVVIKRQRRRIV